MLNRPVRKAKATDRPVKISGVASLRLSRKGLRLVTGANSVEYTKYTRSVRESHAPQVPSAAPVWLIGGCTSNTTTAPTAMARAMAAAGTSSPRSRLNRSHQTCRALRPAPAATSPPSSERKRPRFMPPPS